MPRYFKKYLETKGKEKKTCHKAPVEHNSATNAYCYMAYL